MCSGGEGRGVNRDGSIRILSFAMSTTSEAILIPSVGLSLQLYTLVMMVVLEGSRRGEKIFYINSRTRGEGMTSDINGLWSRPEG